MPPTETTETVEQLTLLQQLRAKCNEDVDALALLVDQRTEARDAFLVRDDDEKRSKDDTKPTDEERAAFDVAEEEFAAEFARREAALKHLDQRIAEQEIIERRRQEAAAASGRDTRVVGEPLTYREDNAGDQSYFVDLCMTDPKIAQSMRSDPTKAMERLNNHAKDVEGWMTKRAQARDRLAEEQIDRAEREFSRSFLSSRGVRGFDASPFERRVNPNRTTGQGGFFVPPLWLIDDYIPALRAGRAAAGLCRSIVLPEGTDSINIPKISTATKVAVQTQDAAAVASQDFTDTSVQANVKTLAGQEDVAIQLLEQSPGQIVDRVIMEDLLADYNRLVDQQVLIGNGTNSASLNGGQLLGLYPSTNWSGTNLVTWTTSTPLGPGYNMVLGAAASKTAYNRFNLENFHFVGHPRRWFWFATALDGASGTVGRPVVNIRDIAFNVSAIEETDVPFEGLAGRTPFGAEYYIDGNVPVTDNGSGVLSGTNDVTIGAKWDDLWLFEGDLRTRVLPEVLSGTLEVRFQVYNYVAFLARYGQSITIAQGTGFSAPTSAIDSSVTF